MECHISLIMNKLELHIPMWTNFRSTKGKTKLCCRICTLSSHLHKVQNNTTQGLGIRIYVLKKQFKMHGMMNTNVATSRGKERWSGKGQRGGNLPALTIEVSSLFKTSLSVTCPALASVLTKQKKTEEDFHFYAKRQQPKTALSTCFVANSYRGSACT